MADTASAGGRPTRCISWTSLHGARPPRAGAGPEQDSEQDSEQGSVRAWSEHDERARQHAHAAGGVPRGDGQDPCRLLLESPAPEATLVFFQDLSNKSDLDWADISEIDMEKLQSHLTDAMVSINGNVKASSVDYEVILRTGTPVQLLSNVEQARGGRYHQAACL